MDSKSNEFPSTHKHYYQQLFNKPVIIQRRFFYGIFHQTHEKRRRFSIFQYSDLKIQISHVNIYVNHCNEFI